MNFISEFYISTNMPLGEQNLLEHAIVCARVYSRVLLNECAIRLVCISCCLPRSSTSAKANTFLLRAHHASYRSGLSLQLLQIGSTLHRTADLPGIKEIQLLMFRTKFPHIGVNQILDFMRVNFTRTTVTNLWHSTPHNLLVVIFCDLFLIETRLQY